MTEFVEECEHVDIFHQSGIVRSRKRKVADEDRFRNLNAANSIQHRGHLRMAVLAGTWMHVEIKSPDCLSFIDDIPGFDTRVPCGHVLFLLERHMKQCRC